MPTYGCNVYKFDIKMWKRQKVTSEKKKIQFLIFEQRFFI